MVLSFEQTVVSTALKYRNKFGISIFPHSAFDGMFDFLNDTPIDSICLGLLGGPFGTEIILKMPSHPVPLNRMSRSAHDRAYERLCIYDGHVF